MENKEDLRLQQRAVLLQRGITEKVTLFTQEESKKATEDSIRFLSESYK